MKTTLQTIFEFILSLASLFFRRHKKAKPDQPVAGHASSTGTSAPQYGSSTGSCGSDAVSLPPQSPANPVNLLGWALIVSAAGGYIYRLFS